MVEVIILVVIYIIAVIVFTYIGKDRSIGAVRAFLINLFFTPIIGGIIVLSSPKPMVYHVSQYKCPRCDFHFTEYSDECPLCVKDGYNVKLKEITKEMT